MEYPNHYTFITSRSLQLYPYHSLNCIPFSRIFPEAAGRPTSDFKKLTQRKPAAEPSHKAEPQSPTIYNCYLPFRYSWGQAPLHWYLQIELLELDGSMHIDEGLGMATSKTGSW